MSNSLSPTIHFVVFCKYHDCECIENEHYDDWFQKADLSGFYCPTAYRLNNDERELDNENDKCEIVVCPINHPEIDIFALGIDE